LETDNEDESVASFLERNRFSRSFIEHYFLPMGSAIWSAPFETFEQFPIRFIAEFYKNHGLLGVTNRPQWRVIKGGSKTYIEPLTRDWRSRIHCNAPVSEVRRSADGVWVKTNSATADSEKRFDHVVFACHSDQALRILGNSATQKEAQILSAFPMRPIRPHFTPNPRCCPVIVAHGLAGIITCPQVFSIKPRLRIT
jgi:predicted NAD/FAD-binding protein